MCIRRPLRWVSLAFIAVACCSWARGQEDANFYRGVNLNGPAVSIDGNRWEGRDAPNLRFIGQSFENQSVKLHPETDRDRALMLRSSVWGDPVEVVLTEVPKGQYSVFLYVWEDNDATVFRVSLNGREVQSRYNSRGTGIWERLGPWPVDVQDGTIRLVAQGGHANLSGLEIWSGLLPATAAPKPVAPQKPRFDVTKAREFWSLRPIADPAPPPVKNAAWPTSDLDRFILAALEAKQLTPAPPADRRALIRRATFDLIGLPPTPEEIEAFLADSSPDAFARVVDRLLASPHYGERWGRHWLDVVRYADTAGDNSDYPIPQLYRYRNWVIDAINADKPYDVFLREQIAGDLLPAANDQERHNNIVATGYLANSRRFGSVVEGYPWHLTIEDTIDNLGRTVLGLTINCARCHDHKFDPISLDDYYSLYGFFASTRYPFPGIELDKVQRDLVPLAPADEVAMKTKERNEKQAALDSEVKRIEKEKGAADKKLKEAEESRKNAAGDGPIAELDAQVAEAKKLTEALKKSLDEAKKQRDQFSKQPPPYETAYAVAESTKVENARVHIKGDPGNLGYETPRKFPDVLGGYLLPPDVQGSGRLELAKWLTDPANPLTARVMVNRIWLYHFGKGIVQTPSDFGKQGMPPTHPELLDWLARRFIESGWSMKATHRLMMLSSTYQMSSADPPVASPDPRVVDANNDLLWKFPHRRLDAESIRDCMLAISGELDRTRGGAHPFPQQPQWDFTQHKPFKAVYETNLRSVYLMTQRIQRHPYLAIFDGPDTNASTSKRITSTTALQALFMLNDAFVYERARHLAARLIAETPDDVVRVRRIYALAFGREPTAEEQAAAAEYLQSIRAQAADSATDEPLRFAWESYVRVLLRTNEFVYVP